MIKLVHDSLIELSVDDLYHIEAICMIKFSAWIIYKTFLHIYTVPKVNVMFFLLNTPIYFPLLDSTYIYLL